MNLLDAHLHAPDDTSCFRPGSQYYVNAVRQTDWGRILDFSLQNRNVRGFIGIHPWHVDTVAPGWEIELRGLLERQASLGIGEIGLDACGRRRDSLDAQKQILRAQIAAALDLERPVSLHCCRAWERLIDLIGESLAASGAQRITGLVHRFNAGLPEMRALLDFGLCISFHPSIQTADPGQIALLSHCPIDRLLIESDSETGPDPDSIAQHYNWTADRLGISLETLARQVEINGSFRSH